MARQSFRKKSVPQKYKAESNESDNDSLFPEVVDNDTGNDLPDKKAAAEYLKEEEQDAAKNTVQGPKNRPVPDGDCGSSSSSGSETDGGGVGRIAGAGGESLTRS